MLIRSTLINNIQQATHKVVLTFENEVNFYTADEGMKRDTEASYTCHWHTNDQNQRIFGWEYFPALGCSDTHLYSCFEDEDSRYSSTMLGNK